MNIFIDTAVRGCNVVLFDDDKILAMHQEPIERGHAEEILPIYQRLLENIEAESSDIKTVYVTVGPGSFTGLRVGLTVARFIGFSLQVPVHGITTFQCFSSGCTGQGNRAILIETKRKDFYTQILDDNHKPLSEAQSLSGDDVINLLQGDDVILTGDAVERFVSEFAAADYQTDPQEMFDLENIISEIQAGMLDFMAPDPFYIRDADVSQPKRISHVTSSPPCAGIRK